MGGNAFKKYGIEVDRMNSGDYAEVIKDVAGIQHRSDSVGRWSIPAHVREKDSHGDIDVLVECARGVGVREEIRNLIHKTDNIEEYCNGPVVSMARRICGKIIQYDFIRTEKEWHDFALQYHSWNDAGNLLGRIAHRLGFKLGFDGLYYVIREGSHVVAEVNVTRDWDDAISFLGFDAKSYRDGFDTFIDLFNYTASNIWFNRDIYLLENRNHVSRVRDAKRKTYKAFLEWLETAALPGYPWDDERKKLRREDALSDAFDRWPLFRDEFMSICEANTNRKLAAITFNGEAVGRATGLSGKDLGQAMERMRQVIPDRRAFENFCIHNHDDAVRLLLDKAVIERVVSDPY